MDPSEICIWRVHPHEWCVAQIRTRMRRKPIAGGSL
ncbi:uncharacterized protein CPUR_08813 [Claviceps purpurea 20.1]|uniref:Uncharacterized protein n=1 Tax=Claviceps purpurea (strain 20.1) TaxID=1111077 RepID=M1WIQ2_CLAP2|nr:uncharacterized protein CPUR_08813 [Claviceps purpurea 20.1]